MTTDEPIAPAYRAKVVEPVRRTTRAERRQLLERAGYNLFRIPAEAVAVDLLTDSGTGALSAEQQAAMMRGDEAYAGGSSFARFEATVREVTGLPHVLPVHQGRAAERVLLGQLVGPGDAVPGNGHFDTTRAHVEALGAEALDLPIAPALRPSERHPFKGDIDLQALERVLMGPRRVPLVMLTITSNRYGGQPVSLRNVEAARELCDHHGVPLFFDAARFAENAGLAVRRDPELEGASPEDVARAYFEHVDGCTMSAKKDGLSHIGGFVAVRDSGLADAMRPRVVLEEGFVTYGGMTGRDLEAIAVGLREALTPGYLEDRLDHTAYLAARLEALGVPVVRPPGGHAIFVDAGAWLPTIPKERYPGQALAVALYLEGGVRACELGSLAFGAQPDGSERPAEIELVRLALPRRVYGREHLDFVAEVFACVDDEREQLGGFRIVHAPQALRHFSATLAPLPPMAQVEAAE